MDASGLIARKRDGGRLADEAIAGLVRGLADGAVDDAQAAAMAMAIRLRGLDVGETVALTRAMRDSGPVLDWRRLDLPGPVLDKHSTGGVGDATSLVLAPVLAACGGFVPMMSGRALGHTGGTLDKLEAIPGVRTDLSRPRVAALVRRHGLAIFAAGPDMAPADRRFYAVRHRTATVDSPGLIVASILSKKLAAGVGTLVLDVKAGNGAWCRDAAEARRLAGRLLAVAAPFGLLAAAAVTDMSQPLADGAGAALEVAAALAVLSGHDRNSRLYWLTVALAARALLLAGLAPDLAWARRRVVRVLAGGHAAERFAAMVHGQGGPSDLLDRPDRHLPRAAVFEALVAPAAGWLAAIDTRRLGEAVALLAGGADGRQDPSAGIDQVLPIGSPVAAGQPLLRLHGADRDRLAQARAQLAGSFQVAPAPCVPPPLVHGWRRPAAALAAAEQPQAARGAA